MKNVIIVGKPNVGKSTLFNKLAGRKKALVHPEPGMTRDLISHQFGKWQIIDSGGIDFGNEEFSELIRRQVFYAIEEADLIIFLLDGKEGITALDQEISRILRKKNKKVFLVWNKIDSKIARDSFSEAFSLGFKEIFKISAEHNIGIEDLKKAIEKELNLEAEEEEEKYPKIAILGKPNVGKSSLINTLTGKEKAMVSSTPGTTRDPIEVQVKYYGKKYIFIDTAGEKRQAKIKEEQEFLSLMKGRKALKEVDIVLFLLDASTPITNQDREIGFEIENSFKGFIFLGNKVDLISESEREEFKKNLYLTFPYFDYVPLLFISALKKYNIPKIWKYIIEIQKSLNYRIPTGILNRTFREFMKSYPVKDRKFYYITQAEINPPTFVLVGNKIEKPKESFLRFLQSRIRNIYPFKGVPIKILLKKR